MLTPQDAQCGGSPPRCDTGGVPAGSYLFDFTAANASVRGQTLAEWFVREYMLGSGGAGHPDVAGYYIDDGWDVDPSAGGRGPSECGPHWREDTGLSDADIDAQARTRRDRLATAPPPPRDHCGPPRRRPTAPCHRPVPPPRAQVAAFRWVADRSYAAILAAGKFAWNQLLNNDPFCPACGNCPGPWVRRPTCAQDLRTHCNATGPVHTRAMLYGIRGCGAGGRTGGSTADLSDIGPHVAAFLLLRGEHAWLSTGWSGCSVRYGWNEKWLDADYGLPADEVCAETAPGSGVFRREWSKATVELDCNTWTPTATFKPGAAAPP